MISLLQQILCVLLQIPYFALWAVVSAFNLIVLALGTLLEGLLFILPPFPSMPALPSQFTTVMGWINWVFPVGTVLTILATLATLWLAWQGVALALRWARAVQ